MERTALEKDDLKVEFEADIKELKVILVFHSESF